MDFQGKNDSHDALDQLLKRYLLERDAAVPEGDGLMEMAANSVMSSAPTVKPDPAKAAEMIKRLQQNFPEAAPVSGIKPGPALKYGLFSIGALAVLGTAFMLFFNPFSKNTAADMIPGKENIALNGPSLSDNLPDLPADQSLESEESSSLQNGDGNPLMMSPFNAHRGTGKGIRSSTSRGSVKRLGPVIIGDGSSDSRTGSNELADNPDSYVFPVRELDPFPLRELYAQTTTQSKFIQLEPSSDHLIVGTKGTVIHIPRNAFVDASSGESVSQTVQLEVKELYNKSEFLNSNISTVFDGQALVSGGALYLDATAAGRRLRLAGDKTIYVEFAQNEEEVFDMQVYHGNFDSSGELQVEVVGGKYNKLVPLPIEKLHFDEFWCNCSEEKTWNRQWSQLFSPEFENSWIATREFRQRLVVLRDMGYYEPGFQIYLDNTDKELWKVDKMVAERLRQESDARKTNNDEVAYFVSFSQQGLTQSESFNDYGLDLTKSDARRQLLYRRVSKEESERLIRLAKLRNSFVQEIENRLILDESGKYLGTRKGGFEKAGAKLVAGFLLHQLGWNMISKPSGEAYNAGRKREIKVRLTGNIAYESTRAFLVFSKMQTVLPGKPTTSQLFRFKKVPSNLDAYIVVLGFKNAMPYLGLLKLPRDKGGDRIVEVVMEETRFDAFFASLKALD